jgi:hypothetical protein
MALLRAVAAGTIAAVSLAACGGGADRRHAGAGQTIPSPTTTSATSAPVRPPPGFAGRLLTDNELRGFLITDAVAYTTAGRLVSSEGGSAAEASAELRMLTANGFEAAAREDLDKGGEAGLSLVERFASPAAARRALFFYVAQFRDAGRATHFTPFAVGGLPGAGFVLGNPGGTGVNIAFRAGDYYYLIGRVGSGPGPEAGLLAAARSLYDRVKA